MTTITQADLDAMIKRGITIADPKKTEKKQWNPSGILKFTIPGPAVPAPRMTQRDKWMKRPCVMRYREYSSRLRSFVNLNDMYVGKVTAVFHLPMSKSWSQKKMDEHQGKPHRIKNKGGGDVDNFLKSILDSLMKEDSMVWSCHIEKYWCYSGQERTELTFQA